MIWGGLPINAIEVADIIRQTSATYLKQGNKNSEYIDKRREELIKLRDEIADSELEFFKILNINNQSSLTCLSELQKRIDNINMANGGFSAEELQQVIFSDPTILTTLDDISLRALDNAISTIEWDFTNLTGISQDKFVDDIIDYFSSLIMTTSSKNSKFVSNYFTKLENQGLKRILHITRIHDEKDIFHIQISDENTGDLPKVSSELKSKLLEVIRKYTNTQAVKTKEQFKELIIKKLIRATGRNIDLMSACIRYEVTQRAEYYDLSRNLSSLKGFIQEVWSNAMISTLMGRVGATMPTGKMHSLQGSKGEIPIDAVLQDFNFQIKSFNLINGKYEIHQSNKEIGSFIRDRAQMSSSDLLIAFFGSYQFNQPFYDPTLIKNYQDSYLTPQEYKDYVYSGFDRVIQELDPTFQAYVDKIIRIDSTFSTKELEFSQEQLYFNTFFIVNKKIVPASIMLDAIIACLDDRYNSDLIKFEADSIKTTEGVNTFEDIIQSGDRLKKYSGEVFKTANLVKISYTIYLDFDEVLGKAEQLAARVAFY